MSVGWEVYDVGTVGNDDSSNATVIVGIVLGILGALVLGAGLALVVMMHLRKKKIGEETSDTSVPQSRTVLPLVLSLFAFAHIPSSAGHFLCPSLQQTSRTVYQRCSRTPAQAPPAIFRRRAITDVVSQADSFKNAD